MKNYKRMTSKQLEAELKNCTEEQAFEINAILNSRKIKKTVSIDDKLKNVKAEVEAETEAETETGVEAEAETAKTTEVEAETAKTTEVELAALAEKVKTEALNHRCEVVPFNTIEWSKGVIAGVIIDKRSKKILYAIKLDDGRRIVKAYGSKLIKILDEVVASATPTRIKDSVTSEELEKMFVNCADKVGYDVEVEKDGVTHEGTITAVVKDKRNMKCIFKITLKSGETIFRSNLDNVTVVEELSEEGQKLHDNYVERVKKAIKTPAEKVEDLKALIAKLEAQLQTKKEELEKSQEQMKSEPEAETEVDDDIL